ncbi:MAG: DUF2971 domain-containing protein [Chthoniobacterales bacterium]
MTLLDPETWDDKNDAHFLAVYKQKKKLITVLAACFTKAPETYHHWRVFANGSSGVCLTFKGPELLRALFEIPGVRAEHVTYLTLKDIRQKSLHASELPFLKRIAFEHEEEFRVIYESSLGKFPKLDIYIL